MNKLIIILLILIPFVSEGQKRMKKKESSAAGTLFGYWGYNRSAYTKSNMHFVGPGYDFTLSKAVAHDNPEAFDPSVYFNPSKITIPQFNVRIGYYFKDHWAISFGYDHMKYILADKNSVLLSGQIDEDVNSNWEGTYSGEPVITNRKLFHYENSDGLNYLRLELTRTDMWLKFGERDWFAFSTNVGVSLGGLLSFNDFTFGQRKDVRTISMSGYGLSAHFGTRFEFFRHVFIEPKIGTGLNHQVKVKNRPNDPSSFTRHAYGYASFETVIGFFLYIRTKNGCGSCPTW